MILTNQLQGLTAVTMVKEPLVPLGSLLDRPQGQSALSVFLSINLLNPTGYVMHQQFNIQQFYAVPTLYLCVLYLSEKKQQLVPLTS